ncbi:hypothetical protein [Flavobacterium psychrolimnae]|uniref:Uncharacterized protein n=1 Tax=Flavobacterium psychrolimnae TaxID=249351 RepID=A0A366AWQ3_9FLAO|nr:hypothetical protein [Flavobacterium psychrolimnae]RBN49091.1 hypothetical protein DR980_15180 [Flavobacterium psychrolimnae]
MSTKKGGLQFGIIIIVLIALFYTAKVYWFKEELKTVFGEQKNEKFEITDLNTSFGIIDRVESGSIIAAINNKPRKISYNVPYIHIKAKIRNITGDNIEDAELTPELNVNFKYGEKSYLLFRKTLYCCGQEWKAGETITVDDDFYLTSDKSFDSKVLNHNPEQIKLNLYLKASNSVGLNSYDMIYNEIINSWIVNPR